MILDELSHAENILKHGIDKKHQFYDLAILAKYYGHLGKDYKAIRRLLIEYCQDHIRGFNIVTESKTIESIVDIVKKYKLRVPRAVVITLPEITAIQSIENEDYRKVLFVLLVIAKENKQDDVLKKGKRLKRDAGLYCNDDVANVFQKAKLRWTINRRNKFLHEMYLAGLIDATYNGTISVKFGADGHLAFIVQNFQDVLMDYLRYCGDPKVKKCQTCGGLFRQRVNNQIYCRECGKAQEREKTNLRKKRFRSKFGTVQKS